MGVILAVKFQSLFQKMSFFIESLSFFFLLINCKENPQQCLGNPILQLTIKTVPRNLNSAPHSSLPVSQKSYN